MLHETDKTILNQLAEDKQNKELSLYVSRSKKSLQKKGYCVISSNIYVFVNTSTQHKINILKHFFQLYRIEMSELVFYLKEDKYNI